MNVDYLERAKAKIPNVRLLIICASKRATELSRGAKPLVPVLPNDERSHLDISLLEIAEGKISVAIDAIPSDVMTAAKLI